MADSNSLDSLITQNEAPKLASIDINASVLPGHDMVINHVDGSQELAQGHVALAVMAKEAEVGDVVSKDDVEALASESPRSKDPEVNGPDQQVAGQVADAVVADSQADAPLPPVPAFPTPVEEEASVDASEGSEEAADAGKKPA